VLRNSILGTLLLIAGAFASFQYFKRGGIDLEQSDLPRPPGHSTVLPPEAGEFPHSFSSKEEAVALYEEARLAIEQGRVNQARKMLGRLERSNIDFVFKERASALRQSIPLPPMADFRDSITLGEIRSDPYSYRDAVFLWEGTVQSVNQSGIGLELNFKPENAESLSLKYTGTDSGLQENLSTLQPGEKVSVYGRVLSADGEGRQLTFQLLGLQ